LVAYVDRNPLYGSVYIWVLLAIRNRIVTDEPQYTLISEHTSYIAIVHGISMVALWSWLGAESYYGVDLTNVDIGIFFQE